MATLIADVQSRFSNDLLCKLTNIDAVTLVTVNSAFLQICCDDVQSGEFEAQMNAVYDSTNRAHITFACLLVKLKCMEYGGSSDETSKELRERIEKLAKTLREVGARDRVSPKSSSDLTPTPNTGNGPFRPSFDDPMFEPFTPEAPSALGSIDLP